MSEQKTVRVKVIKAGRNLFWYSDFIGKEFDSFWDDGEQAYLVNDTGFSMWGITLNTGWIAPEDCELVVMPEVRHEPDGGEGKAE